jgi:pyruvate,orthophosphate dikinase
VPASPDRYVHAFAGGVDDVRLVGGKGASLARMEALGLPIPPGFTISTDGWQAYRAADSKGAVPADVRDEVLRALAAVEEGVGRRLGALAEPLLVSVRSGAPASMPGMMDTVLDLGMTEAAVPGLARLVDESFAWDVYGRLLHGFAQVVRGIPEDDLAGPLAVPGVRERAAALKAAIAAGGRPFPDDPLEQLWEAVEAVWQSWDNDRARRYRKFRGISDDLGTAVTVQAMVFGNLDAASGTGVVFTRDPATGEPGAYGDFLARAQGEDVVAGGHVTEPLAAMAGRLPGAWAALGPALPALEQAYRDMCDVEFTVERGRLWILQARAGQRSGAAAVRIAVDLVDEGLISVEEAIERVPLPALEGLQAAVFAADAGAAPRAAGAAALAGAPAAARLGVGIGASPGAAVGAVVFDSLRAQELAAEGRDVVLVRSHTSPDDIGGMIAARAIVTAAGGRASHAAVVARGIGRPAVCSLPGLELDPSGLSARVGATRLVEGTIVSVDGSTGVVVLGALPLVAPQPTPEVARLLAWCDERRRCPIVAAAAVPAGATLIDVGWEGADSGPALAAAVRDALAEGAPALALALPLTFAGADLRPPAAPWAAVVCDDDRSWTARLLAARIPLDVP